MLNTSTLRLPRVAHGVRLATELLDRGADVNVADDDGQTPLHTAVTCESPELVELLVARGAHEGAEDGDGETPLTLCTPELRTVTETAVARRDA